MLFSIRICTVEYHDLIQSFDKLLAVMNSSKQLCVACGGMNYIFVAFATIFLTNSTRSLWTPPRDTTAL